MNELDPKDPVTLFIRADERIEQVEVSQHDIHIQFRDHKNEIAEKFRDQNAMIQELLKRMDGQVSFTGRKNTEDIGKLTTRMEKIDTQLFDKDTGLISQFVAGKRAMYGILATGLTALVAWFWQHFWK